MYYQVKVQLSVEDKGKIKNQSEVFLVDAVSITDAERKVNNHMSSSINEYEVVSVTSSKISEIIN